MVKNLLDRETFLPPAVRGTAVEWINWMGDPMMVGGGVANGELELLMWLSRPDLLQLELFLIRAFPVTFVSSDS